MKKLFLTLAAGLIGMTASAYTISTPTTWSEDFVEMSKDSDYPTGGWITYGNESIVNEVEQYYFGSKGEGPYYVFLDQGSKTMALATTDFINGSQADQWLVSPEVEVPYDEMTLAFNVCTYTAKAALGNNSLPDYNVHPFKVLVSEEGSEKGDFKELYSAFVKNSGSENIESVERVINLNGYKGKKVHFAFVVTGSNIGMTGFTNIRLGQYTFYVTDDLNKEMAEVGSPISIDFNTKVKAPVATPYLNAVLYINGEKITEKSYKKAFGSATSYTAVIQRIKLENIYTPTDDTPLSYKLELTPDFEGAIPTVIEGGFGFPKYKYLSNVVCEEMTGTKCGWCPRGIAALEYYHDKYPGSETQGKVINIGIHSSALGTDPMATGVERYLTSLAEVNGTAGLPGAVFNRNSQGKDPVCAGEVERQIALESNNTAKIVKVEMPEGDMNDIEGKTMKVTVDVKNGFDSQQSNLSMAIVLLENNVHNNSSLYNQNNYNNKYPDGQAIYDAIQNENMGAVKDMIPYFNQFSSSGEYNTDPVSYNKMYYQHVARGIYPSFAGETLSQKWTADEAQTYTIEFAIPSNVMDPENLEVVALVMNNSSRGSIVASDNMKREFFNSDSGVDAVESASSIKVYNEAGTLVVEAAAGCEVEVYALDGVKIGNYTVADGKLSLESGLKGAVIVKVTSNEAIKIQKLIF